MIKYSAEEGRKREGVPDGQTGLAFTNKPRRWEKEREPAEGWIIKYAWYSTMFHSAQMSHSGTWGVLRDSCEAPVSECVHMHTRIYPHKHTTVREPDIQHYTY